MKILCIEDDYSLARLLEETLLQHHYQVDLANDGQNGINFAEVMVYDLILLDWDLPKLDGIRFCQQLRSASSTNLSLNRNTLVILMTALDTITNRVIGLDAGADDYIVKPFNLDELLARIRALLRRNSPIRSPVLTWGDLILNPNNCRITYQDQEISLTLKEYEILELFLRNPDQIFSINRLLDCLWTLDNPPTEGAVRAHIKGLRHKFRMVGITDIFETNYKLGYRLKPPSRRKQEPPMASIGLPKNDRRLKSIKNQQHNNLEPVMPELQQLWQQYRQSYCDRVAIIQQTIIAWQRGTLTAEQQHQAEREAHTLIGSLGCFGLEQASHLARQIQQILQQKQPLQPNQLQQLGQMVQDLQHQLEQQQPLVRNDQTPFPITNPNPIDSWLLIVEDDLPLAQQIAIEAIIRGFQAEIATNLQQARQLLSLKPFGMIILDLNFPQSTETGLDFLAAIREQDLQIPVIIITAEESLAQKVEAARLGIECFLEKPITPPQILTTVIQVWEQTHQSIFRLLIVDDDPNILDLMRHLLETCGYEVITLNQPEQFWETLEMTVPDLLILDIALHPGYPSGNVKTAPITGFDLCQVIRNDPRWNRLPVLFLSAYNDIATIERGFAVGGDDFLQKPITAAELLGRVRTRLDQRKLWKITEIDDLTGLSLRRKTLQDLTRLFHLAHRQKQPLSLALLDLDRFKNINDLYGHEMGDRVLSYFGQLLSHSFRQEDAIGRWGGEEFLIGMYGTTKQEAQKRLEQILAQLNQYQFITPEDQTFVVTFSAGIAQFPDDGTHTQNLYHAADIALYQAKIRGRNCILVTE